MKNFLLSKKALLGKSIAILGLGVLAAPAFALSPLVTPFWTVQDGKLLDPNGNPFVFRGVTVEQNLAPDKALQAIKDAAALGANAVQVEINGNLYNQEKMITGEQLKAIINTCKENKIVCVLEPYDVAGYPVVEGAGIPSTMASFWSWPGISEAIAGQQSYIILGFGNQILGPMSQQEYVSRMMGHPGEFGYGPLSKFILMIDGSTWGQDADKAMYEFAKQITNNGIGKPYLIYSVDMFDAYTTPESVRNYIASFAEINAPLVIGGFAPTAYYHPHNNFPRPAVVYDLPEDAVMQYAQQYGTGYFGWSWSGNSNSALDIVSNWNVNSLTSWGNLLFNGANGIKATAKTASIFNNSSSSVVSARSSSVVSSERAAPSSSSRSSVSLTSRSSSSSTSLSCPPGNTWPDCPRSSSASSRSSSSVAPVTKAQCSYVVNSQWSNGFTATIRIKNTSNVVINGWDVNWQYTDGSKITNLWNATLNGNNPYNAKNLSWNSRIQPGQTVEFGFQGNKSAAAATVPAVTGAVCQ